ncbi:MAG: type II toxin-antitoxin system HipA family toxin [Bdellovibrionaceae bacterium]|nr:type II toxin-antitoxin system HipA family toxin [Pseudobdellovibrionaceae bacterium]
MAIKAKMKADVQRGHPRDTLEVHLHARELGLELRIGTLYRHATRTDLPASFEYSEPWLNSKNAFMLDPRLELWKGEQHPANQSPAFGIFLDSAPDRWGRVLLERREAAQARREGRKMKRLQEVDFLLGVSDITRMGALRFRVEGEEPFLDHRTPTAPPVTSLRELAEISRRIEEPGIEVLPEYERWLALLIAPGTSLGGARPKANFIDTDERLWIAKFPAHEDRYDVGAWEFLVHRLAEQSGISVPSSRLESLSERYATFCVERFDRVDGSRRLFASAMTLLERRDGDIGASYLDMAEFISNHGAKDHVDSDLLQLFRRVVFNVVVGNRDDHLRNHGFIRDTTGWRLAPAYDMNPNPHKVEHALTLDGASAAPNLDIVRETAEFYRLDQNQANQLIQEIREIVQTWRETAASMKLPKAEISLMENAFHA